MVKILLVNKCMMEVGDYIPRNGCITNINYDAQLLTLQKAGVSSIVGPVQAAALNIEWVELSAIPIEE